MNEITKIHLGRQQFTVAVSAYKALQDYLQAIKRHGGKDVAEEVELRMAELLGERGVNADKVILDKDVDYLKQQLGAPDDFTDDSKDDKPDSRTAGDSESDTENPRRLFRDPQHGMLAGVASGLAAYFNIDAVVVRLIFIATAFMSGFGIIMYIALWLIVPEVKSSSDRLRLQGKSVTVGTIKDALERADVQGVARRGSKYVSKGVELAARIVLTVIGSAVAIGAAALLCGLISVTLYLLIHGADAAGTMLFPIGVSEHLALLIDAAAGALFALLLLLAGMSMAMRRWRPAGWVTASLLGLLVVAAGAGTAMTFNVVPGVHDRVTGLTRTQIVQLPHFSTVDVRGDHSYYTFQKDSAYYVEFKYTANKQTNPASAVVTKDGVLDIDTTKTVNQQLCGFACLYNDHNMRVTIHAPSLTAMSLRGQNSSLSAAQPFEQQSLALSVYPGADVNVDVTTAKAIDIAHTAATGPDVITFTDLSPAPDRQTFYGTFGSFGVSPTSAFILHTAEQCAPGNSQYNLLSMPGKLTVNDKTFTSTNDLQTAQNTAGSNIYNCVSIAPAPNQ